MAGIVHGGGISAACARYGGSPGDWLDLSTGINPEMAALPDIPQNVWNRLPDLSLVTAAREAARSWYCPGRNAGGIGLPLPVPGTQALIQVLPRLVPQGRRVAILSPTYGEYAHCFLRAGFAVDAIASLDQVDARHGTLVVVNPNNPTGRVLDRETLKALIQRACAAGMHVHVDEAFGDARPDTSVADLASETEGVTVSRSFGKFFGLAGLRLGFVFARPALLDRIEAELGPWSVSGPALHIAVELMQRDQGQILDRLLERKAGLDQVLGEAGIEVLGGTELFALVRHESAEGLYEHLARLHILVRKFDYATDWLRIGLAPDQQGDRRLRQALASASC